MAKKYKIKKQDYYTKDEIQIEISEEIVTPVEIKKTIVSIANIKSTIAFLKEKKNELISEIDEEIQQNQDILDSMKEKIDEVEILPFEVKNNTN